MAATATMCVVSLAQEVEPQTAVTGLPDAAAAEAQLAAMEADEGIDDTLKTALRPEYEKAIALLKTARENAEKAALFKSSLETAPSETEALAAELEALPDLGDISYTAPADAKIENLQKEMEGQRLALIELKKSAATTATKADVLGGRPAKVSERLPVAQSELKTARAQLDAAAPLAGDATQRQIVARLMLEAKTASLQSEVAMLEQEKLSHRIPAMRPDAKGLFNCLG